MQKCVLDIFQVGLTLTLRDECDLAEAEELRGPGVDAAAVFILVLDEFVGWT